MWHSSIYLSVTQKGSHRWVVRLAFLFFFFFFKLRHSWCVASMRKSFLNCASREMFWVDPQCITARSHTVNSCTSELIWSYLLTCGSDNQIYTEVQARFHWHIYTYMKESIFWVVSRLQKLLKRHLKHHVVIKSLKPKLNNLLLQENSRKKDHLVLS